MKIICTDAELQTPFVDEALRDAGHDLVTLQVGLDEDELIAAIADADLLLMCCTAITARVIDAAPNLRGIVKYGVGIDAIDIPAAKARGVMVVNIPGICRGNGRRRRLRLADRAGSEIYPAGSKDAHRWLGAARTHMEGQRHRGQDGGHCRLRLDRAQHGADVWQGVSRQRDCLQPPHGDVAKFRLGREYSLTRQSSGDGFDLSPAEGIEAVRDGDADLDFGGLAVGVS